MIEPGLSPSVAADFRPTNWAPGVPPASGALVQVGTVVSLYRGVPPRVGPGERTHTHLVVVAPDVGPEVVVAFDELIAATFLQRGDRISFQLGPLRSTGEGDLYAVGCLVGVDEPRTSIVGECTARISYNVGVTNISRPVVVAIRMDREPPPIGALVVATGIRHTGFRTDNAFALRFADVVVLSESPLADLDEAGIVAAMLISSEGWDGDLIELVELVKVVTA